MSAKSSCLLGDAGISIFLLSLPFAQERVFYETELRDAIFKGYKKAVGANFRTDGSSSKVQEKEFESYFYEPRAYCTFGAFDLAVISLVDDFEFSSRTFHPFDPMMAADYKGNETKPYFENFLHKVITGPTPAFDSGDGLVNLSAQTFLSTDKKPLFGVSLLKINNSLLIGCGTVLLRAVIRHIKQTAALLKPQGLDVVILESYSWHEITVLMFGTSYRVIVDFLSRIREAQLKDLPDPSLFSVTEQSLLGRYMPKKDRGQAHVFADSNTILGFDFDLFTENKARVLAAIDPTDQVELTTRWLLKPGHSGSVARVLGNDQIDLGLGFARGDLLVRTSAAHDTGGSKRFRPTVECLDTFALKNGDLSPHVLQRYSTIVCPYVPIPAIDEEGNPDFTRNLKELGFSVKQLRRLQTNLRKLGTPKIHALKVLNMFANFNDGLLDRNLYGFFAELLPFMRDVETMIEQAAESWTGDTTTWCEDYLKPRLESFELAYRNRFYNSHRLGEVADFNTDFKGGIQQLVTAFDGAYKAIASVVGNRHSFVAVTGDPSVTSTTFETHLNYFHMFQPEAFLTVAVHEAAWYCFHGREIRIAPYLADSLRQLRKETQALSKLLSSDLDPMRNAGYFPKPDGRYPIEQNFLQTVMLDRLAFCLTYNRDAGLMWYWYLGYFAQLPMAYERPFQPSSSRTGDFLLRLSLVCEPDTDFGEVRSQFPDTLFGQVWRQASPAIRDVMGNFENNYDFQTWKTQVWRFVDNLVASGWTENPVANRPVVERQSIVDEVNGRAEKYERSLKAGEAIPFEEDGRFGPFRFCQVLFFTYLRLTQGLLKSELGSILPRQSPEYKVGDIASGGDGFFDPLGGIYTRDAATRRHYFKYRAALTMSLWDMAIKAKRDAILQRFAEMGSRVKPS